MSKYQAEARAILTDVTAAQDSLWANTQVSFQTAHLYKNVSVARAAVLKQLYYSADWDAAWGVLASRGALVEFDVSYMKNLVSEIRLVGRRVSDESLSRDRRPLPTIYLLQR